MSEVARDTSTEVAQPRRWRIIGPGLIVAATGVGAGDLAATLVAGGNLGYALLWAAVLGCIVKIALAEATGRWHLATGRTIFDGWQSLGTWTSVYFGIYVVVWGFVYGAAAMSSTALPLHAMFEDVPFKTWAVISGVLGMVLVLLGRYEMFEKMIAVLVGVMFVTVVTAAVLATPSLPDALEGLAPTVPDDGFLYTLGLIGGVGGTITMAAYGYWVNSKGWTDASWMRVMRLDNAVAYIATGIFVVSMLIVGAELLHASGVALEGEGSLLDVGDVLEDEYGSGMRWLFLIGFWATSFTSILGVWNGVSLLFADWATSVRARLGRGPELSTGERTSTTSPWFRGYVLWLTFPPMLLLTLDQPVALIVVYGALGALFLPFLAATLLWLMNSSRVPVVHRNGWLSNAVLVIAGALFVVLCVNEVRLLIEDYIL
jgi:Mn2+/Fe2+ NRAMP family transporter